MNRLFLFLLTLHLGSSLLASPVEEEARAQAAAARAILDAYHADSSSTGEERKLRFVYWTPSDREAAAGYRERLTRIMLHIQEFYASEMERTGFGPRSINLDLDEEGLLRIPVVRGAKPFSEYERKSGSVIRKECVPVLAEQGIEADRETLVIFCNMGTWDPEKRIWKHRSPYYAGGSARGGNAWQVDSPILDTTWLDKKEPLMQDGEYGRISMGRHNSIFIGGVAHELGHALGLPHNRQRKDEGEALGTALMGSGNRTYGEELRGEGKGSFLTLAHALRLASHPQFSGSTKGLFQPARGAFADLELCESGDSFAISGRVECGIPVYGVIAYLDPEGGGDYNAPTCSTVPTAEGEFRLEIPTTALVRGKGAELRLLGLVANGSTFRKAFGYQVDGAGKAQLGDLKTRLLLTPLIKARNNRDEKAFAEAGRALDPKSKAGRVARRIAEAGRERKKTVPAEAAETLEELALSDAAPAIEKVGWGKPAYDRIPDQRLVMSAGGRIFEHGIYAHAPSTHSYELGGRWKTLRGTAAVVDGSYGEVGFSIHADGKKVWSTKPTKAGTLRPFEIDLKGVKTIELKVDPLGDPSSDWGYWLEPVLGR